AQWVFGGEYTRGVNDVNEHGNGFESPIISARATTDRSFLAFSQLEMQLPQNFTLTLGASYNSFRLDFQERLIELENPRFSKEVNDFSPRIA
ncbi:TonB-dependent receptor, partial [Aquimarina celericrescens]|nr:TonB-dependent receptor [Aquimarina celericrescens]